MPSVLIFANPISGRGRAKRIAQRLEQRLAAEGYSVCLLLEPAERITRSQLDPNATAAIVIGGDGTVRAVAGRLFGKGFEEGSGFGVQGSDEAGTKGPRDQGTKGADGSPSVPLSLIPSGPPALNPEPRALNPPLLLIPMGTANLMGKHLGIRWDDQHVEDQVIDALRRHRVLRLDTARANDGLLLLVAGVGLDAMIVHELEKRRSGPISYFSYALPAISALGSYDYPPLTVTADGKHVFGPAPAMAFIGNVPEYGVGFPILPLASPTDGVLDLCILPCRSRAEAVAHFLRVIAGEHLHGENVVYTKAKSIRVDSPRAVPVQVDGEAAGHTPLAIDLLPVRLGFIVPS